jgi:hypothetical protein
MAVCTKKEIFRTPCSGLCLDIRTCCRRHTSHVGWRKRHLGLSYDYATAPEHDTALGERERPRVIINY